MVKIKNSKWIHDPFVNKKAPQTHEILFCRPLRSCCRRCLVDFHTHTHTHTHTHHETSHMWGACDFLLWSKLTKNVMDRDFPNGPVAKTLHIFFFFFTYSTPKSFSPVLDQVSGHTGILTVLPPQGKRDYQETIREHTLLKRNEMYFYWRSQDEVCLEICFTNKLAHKLSIHCFEIFFHI